MEGWRESETDRECECKRGRERESGGKRSSERAKYEDQNGCGLEASLLKPLFLHLTDKHRQPTYSTKSSKETHADTAYIYTT
jgi:hypothetical protein